MIFPFYSTLVIPHLKYCIQLWCSQYKKHMDLLKWVQRKSIKMVGGVGHLSYDESLRHL